MNMNEEPILYFRLFKDLSYAYRIKVFENTIGIEVQLPHDSNLFFTNYSNLFFRQDRTNVGWCGRCRLRWSVLEL